MANTTNTQFHSWKPEPLVRGTFSILSSCLITMTLCVWTAVHLNLPTHKKESEQTWRKIKWLITALLAPEMVALIAYCQWKEADELGTKLRDIFTQPHPPTWSERWFRIYPHRFIIACQPRELLSQWQAPFRHTWWAFKNLFVPKKEFHFPLKSDHDDPEEANLNHPPRYPWTLTHSFYAVMGGFALDTRGIPNFLPGNRQRVVVKGEGVHYLASRMPHLIPDMSKASIKDKSKANSLTKTIVCIQAAWFCVQTFSRWSQRLSVSLLELNTLAHAICSLLIYFLWWDKPLDVEEPLLIQGEDIQGIGALMTLCSYNQLHFQGYHGLSIGIDIDYDPMRDIDLQPNERGYKEVHQGQTAFGFKFIEFRYSLGWEDDTQAPLYLDAFDVRCWKLARQFFDDSVPGPSEHDNKLKPKRLVCDRVRNLPGGSQLFASDSSIWDDEWTITAALSPFWIGTLLAGMFYGGIHLTAWTRTFRTDTQSLLWKLSGIGIASTGLILHLCWAVHLGFQDMRTRLRGSDESSDAVGYIFVFFAILLSLFYLFCRTYIIVASFMDITHLPDSAFEVPRWSQYFPHVG